MNKTFCNLEYSCLEQIVMIYCYANGGGGGINLEREYWPLSPGIKLLVVPQFSCMPDQILREENEKTQFSGQNLTFFTAFPFQNIGTYSKKWHMTKRLML